MEAHSTHIIQGLKYEVQPSDLKLIIAILETRREGKQVKLSKTEIAAENPIMSATTSRI